MRRILLICAAIAPLAAACASPAVVSTPHATPPAAYHEPQPDTGGLKATALDQWWKLFADAQLDTLVDEALKSAPDARDAMARLEQANAVRQGQIDQLYLPSGSLSVTGTHTDTSLLSGGGPGGNGGFGGGGGFVAEGPTNSFQGSFNTSWELDLWGRRAAARKSLDADFYTAAFTYEATRTALIANVAQSLFQARGLALQLRDAIETARIAHELARVSQVKFNHGLAAQGDADQATANAESADAQAESLRAQLEVARRTLLVLIGRGFDPLETLPASPIVGTPPPVPATAPGELLRRRPDVRAAEWRITSAMGVLKVDELAVLPTIKVSPGVSITKTTGPFGVADSAWSVGANLTQPILDRPRLIEAIHAQRAVAEEYVIAYEKAVQTAYGDAETAFTYLESDTRRVQMLTGAEHRAESAYEKARIGYARGFNDLTAALQAETTWRNTRSQLTSAQTTQMQRAVQVFKAIGGGWTPERPAAATPYEIKAAKGASQTPAAEAGASGRGG
jgi:NodT family efflux transporter outer membrane factor (OMF) lipoprotein